MCSKGTGEFQQMKRRWVADAALDARHVAPADVGGVGEGFLGDMAL